MYSVPHSQQLSIFIGSLGVGFLLGIAYDLLRVIRLSVTRSKKAHIFFDILYFFCFAVTTFLYILALNKGEIRGYVIAGEIIGAVFYYVSFGIAAIKITHKLVAFLEAFYSLVFRIISAPFKLIKRIFLRLSEKIRLFFKKTEKNSEKIRKKHLPKLRLYVYNLFGIVLAYPNSLRKGGTKHGSAKQEKEC